MKDRKPAPKSTTSKSKKASSRVTAAKWEEAAAAGAAGRRSQRRAIAASVEQVAGRRFQKTPAQAIQGHISARGRRQQARRDSR